MTTVAIAQTCPSENVEENVRESYRLVREAASKGASLVLFPELAFASKKPHDESSALTSAQTCDGWITQQILQSVSLCRVHVGFGFVELLDGKLRNSYVVVSPTGEFFVFSKRLPSESDVSWVSRDDSVRVSDVSFALPEIGRVGVCFDNELASYSYGSVDFVVVPSRSSVVAYPKADPFVVSQASGARVVAYANVVEGMANGGSFFVVDGKPWTYGSSFVSECVVGAVILLSHHDNVE